MGAILQQALISVGKRVANLFIKLFDSTFGPHAAGLSPNADGTKFGKTEAAQSGSTPNAQAVYRFYQFWNQHG